MTEPESQVNGQSQAAALAVLRECARDPEVRADYRTIAEAFADEDYEQIVALAWRYQFSENRYDFKRDLRELQQYVCDKVSLPDEKAS